MGVSLFPPDPRRIFENLDRRVGILERRINPAAAAPKNTTGGPFVVVAPNNASGARKAVANYVCDGVRDEAEINQAVRDLEDGGYGGTVYLLEGDFYTAGPIDLDYSVNLQGVGQEATYIYFDYNADAGARTHVGNPYGNDYVIHSVGDGRVVSHLWLNQYDRSGTGWRGGIRLDGQYSMAYMVKVELDSDPATQPIQNSAVRINGESSQVDQCWIKANGGTGVDGGSDQDNMRITNCHIDASLGIDGDGTDRLHIVGNYIQTGYPDAVATIYGYSDIDYILGTGILIWAGPSAPSLIANNRIEGCGGHGIAIASSSNVSIVNNQIRGVGEFTEKDGIHLRDGCYGLNVQGNMVRDCGRYGINVSDGDGVCFSTYVTNNDLLDSGAVAAFNDDSTDTNIGAGNRLA
jgi:parallel beta-helix repeat protein